MKNVLLTGGTGLIGSHLSELLFKENYSVSILSRSQESNDQIKFYKWNVEKGEIDSNAIKSCDYIVHLAGENISESRWTQKRKKQLLESRTRSTQLLLDAVKKYNPNLKAFISASAVGYYGAISSEHIFTENDGSHHDFLGSITRKWEESVGEFSELNIRTVIYRTGVVLTKNSGALDKVMRPIKLNVGAVLGSGKQYIPWIHIDDLCSAYLKAIEDIQLKGSYNLVAPEHTNNKELTKQIASQLNKPLWLPNIPSFILRLLFGEMADLFLKGSRVSANKIMETGFTFKYPKLKDALKNLL